MWPHSSEKSDKEDDIGTHGDFDEKFHCILKPRIDTVSNSMAAVCQFISH